MIVVPMAGRSSRFAEAGYQQPKFMLEARGRPVFDHAVQSFASYFKTRPFLFVVRNTDSAPEFVKARVAELGIVDWGIEVLPQATRGQAETVDMGLRNVDWGGPVTIFNIDTFRPGFSFPRWLTPEMGFLEVFEGQGENWSFVRPVSVGDTRVAETAEKRAISNLCCTGLYHFPTAASFRDAYNHEVEKPEFEWEKGELYVAPLYNYLIKKGVPVHYHIVPRDQIIFCGVPSEYEAFCRAPK